jgi:hypothetical protein
MVCPKLQPPSVTGEISGVVVMAACCWPLWWRRWWWSDTLWVTLIRLWLCSLSCYLEVVVMQLSLHSHKLYLISVKSSLIPSATRSGVPSSCRSGCGSHYGTVISAAFGIIEGSSSCILTKALFVAHCVMWIYLWFLFYLAVSVLWVAVRSPFFSSFHGTWSNCIVYLPQTMQELLLTQKERWRVRSPCFHCLSTAF